MLVECEFCSKEFNKPEAWIKRSKHSCCSRKCSDELKKKLHSKICEHCGKKFKSKSHQKERKYCSIKCFNKSHESKVTLVCEVCSKNYIVNTYRKDSSRCCSRKCLRVITGELASKRVGILNPNYKGYKNDKRKDKSRLRTWSNEVKRRDNNLCVKCGANNHLCSHHIVPYSVSKGLRFELSNGITLCKTCHSKEHINDKIPVVQLISYNYDKTYPQKQEGN